MFYIKIYKLLSLFYIIHILIKINEIILNLKKNVI